MKTVALNNENKVVTTVVEPRRLNVVLDTCGYDESPRDWSNLGTLLGYHKNYELCEVEELKGYRNKKRFVDDATEYVNNIEAEGGFVNSLFCYEHSNIKFSLKQFNCMFDSGVVGYVFVTKEKLDAEGLSVSKDLNRIIEIVENELVIWNKFLNGEVWRIIDNLGELDCGGYYDFDQAMDEIVEAGLSEFIDEEYTG